MAERRAGRVVLAVAGLLGLVAVLLVVGVALRRGGLDVAANVAQLLTVPVTVGSVVAALVHYAARRPAPHPADRVDPPGPPDPPGPADPRGPVEHDGRPRVFVCPRLERREAVARPALLDALVTAVTTPGPPATTTGVTGATGGGGFGKTTLAKALVHDARVWCRFPDGIVWTALGEHADAAAVAAQANDLTTALTGRRPALNDPVGAGAELAAAVAGRDVLLVLDDVWHETQLRPFLQVLDRAGTPGSGPAVLVTTRRRSVLPLDTPTVGVDAMAEGEAQRLLTRGLPAGPPDAIAAVLRLTGRWPVLLAVANGTVRRDVGRGADAGEALAALAVDLAAFGPDRLGLESESGRDRAVTATLRASLQRLTGAERRRYASLAVFAEDVEIPAAVLAAYWDRLDDGPEPAPDPAPEPVPDVLRGLDDLGLLAEYRLDEPYPRLRLHDVLRGWLRHEHVDRLPGLHAALLDAHAGLVPRVDGAAAWWRLTAGADATARYLADHLAEHLTGAGRHEELTALLLRPDWILARLDAAGPAGLERDLGHGRSPAVDVLARVVRQDGHLLAPLEPAGSVAATLASRLAHEPELAGLHEALLASVDGAYLEPITPLPDLPPRALLRVLDHPGVAALAADPRGRRLVTAGGTRHGGARVWDPRTGDLLHDLDHDAVRALAVDPRGGWVATAGADGVRVWDLGTGAPRHALTGDATGPSPGPSPDRSTAPVDRLVAAPDGAWLAAARRSAPGVQVWDPATGVWSRTLDVPDVRALTGSADGRRLAAVDRAGRIRVWEPVSGRLVHDLAHPGAEVLALAPDGSWLATGTGRTGDDTLRIWDLAAGEVRHVLAHRAIRTLLTAPGHGLLVAAGSWGEGNGDLELLDPATGTVRWRLARPVRTFTAPGADGVLAAVRDLPRWRQDVVLCDATTGRVLRTLADGDADVLALAPDGSWLAGGVFWPPDARVRIWDTAPAEPDGTAPPPAGPLAISPDGRWYATADDTGVHVRDPDTGQDLHVLDRRGFDALVTTADGTLDVGFTSGLDGLATTADGGLLLGFTRGARAMVRAWDTVKGTLRHDLDGPAVSVLLAAEGSLAAGVAPASTAETGVQVTLWDLAGERVLPTVVDENALVAVLAPDGSWLATVDSRMAEYGSGDTVRIWDTATGAERHRLRPRRPGALAVPTDGSLVAVASQVRAPEPAVRVWDPGTGELLHVLGSTGTTVLAVAPDGSWLAAGVHAPGDPVPGAIRIWDLATGTVRHEIDGADPEGLAVAPDGTWLAAYGGTRYGEGAVRVWDTGTWEPVAALRTGQRVREVVTAAGLLGLRSDQGAGLLRLRSLPR